MVVFLIFEGKTNYQNKGNNNNFDENDFNFVENKNVKTKIDLSEYNIDDSQIKACYINGLLKIKLKKNLRQILPLINMNKLYLKKYNNLISSKKIVVIYLFNQKNILIQIKFF